MPRASRSNLQIDRYIDQKVAAATYRAEKRAQKVADNIPADLSTEFGELRGRVEILEQK
mgnify:CR=1 FL=1|tara:strand:- start:433 stop:609 length:177 start_codon:yes stop_codon:yes gene_type:complete